MTENSWLVFTQGVKQTVQLRGKTLCLLQDGEVTVTVHLDQPHAIEFPTSYSARIQFDGQASAIPIGFGSRADSQSFQTAYAAAVRKDGGSPPEAQTSVLHPFEAAPTAEEAPEDHRFTAIEPHWQTYFPLGAVISTADQTTSEVRGYSEDGWSLAVDWAGRPAALSGEVVLGHWDAGYRNRLDRLACLVSGLSVDSDTAREALIAGGRVRILMLEHGLRCAIAPGDGSYLRGSQMRSLNSEQAYGFWLPFSQLEMLSGTRHSVTLGFDGAALGTQEVKPVSEAWEIPRWASRTSQFAVDILTAILDYKRRSGDPDQMRLAERLTARTVGTDFSSRKGAEISLVD